MGKSAAPRKRRTSSELEALDRKLAHWAATDREHKAEVARRELLHAHDLDWFDVEAYQRMIYSNGWNR